jgi:hypothetical protein
MVTVCVEVYVPAAGLKVGVATVVADADVLLAKNARKRKWLKKLNAFK